MGASFYVLPCAFTIVTSKTLTGGFRVVFFVFYVV